MSIMCGLASNHVTSLCIISDSTHTVVSVSEELEKYCMQKNIAICLLFLYLVIIFHEVVENTFHEMYCMKGNVGKKLSNCLKNFKVYLIFSNLKRSRN